MKCSGARVRWGKSGEVEDRQTDGYGIRSGEWGRERIHR